MEYYPLSPDAFGFRARGCLFKNASDVFDTSVFKMGKPKDVLKGMGIGALTGSGGVPKGISDKISKGFTDIKNGQGMEGFTEVMLPGMGKGVRPAAVNTYLQTKGQQKYDPNGEVDKGLISKVKPVEAPLPAAPVPDAPTSMRSRSVTDAARAAKAAAGKRKGFMSTLFAKETGGFGGTGGGASLLGG
jgi:hypothetical protein